MSQGMEVRRVANSGSCGHFSEGMVEGVEGQVSRVVLKKSPGKDSGGWGVRIGDVRGGDRREKDKENSEEWMLGNFKLWLHHSLCASGRFPNLLNLNVLIS